MMKLGDYIVNFIEHYCDSSLARKGGWMPYQQRASLRLIRVVVKQLCQVLSWLWSRQCGKTECLAVSVAVITLFIFYQSLSEEPLIEGLPNGEEIEMRFPKGFRVGIFAPKDESGGRDFGRIKPLVEKIVRKHPELAITRSNEHVMTVVMFKGTDKERVLFHMELHSAAPTANIESGTFDLLVCEEAQDIERQMMLAKIDPMRANTAGSRIDIGTVGDVHCQFDEDIDFNKQYAPENHLEIPYTVPVAENLGNGSYRTFVQEQIDRYGEDSLEFRRKFKLERNYAVGMLASADGFVKIWSAPRENRWEREPDELPDFVYIVAALDVANTNDQSVLKVGTSDWRMAAMNPEGPQEPHTVVRWSKSYSNRSYEAQFAEMQIDLQAFPSLLIGGIICIDATGDRGNIPEFFQNAGYLAHGVIFTTGQKGMDVDPHSGVVKSHGSKSAMCFAYEAAVNTGRFRYAADETYMGTLDFFRALGHNKPDNHAILAPHPEYEAHKFQATHCKRLTPRSGVLSFEADSETSHDDQVTADILLVHASRIFVPFNVSQLASYGQRITSSLVPGDMMQIHAFTNNHSESPLGHSGNRVLQTGARRLTTV